MAKQKTISLLGKELILHQRFAIDVLGSMDRPDETEKQQIENVLLAVSDALKENWINLKGHKRKRVERQLSPVGLSEKLTFSEIVNLWEQVAELEGLVGGGDSKKK